MFVLSQDTKCILYDLFNHGSSIKKLTKVRPRYKIRYKVKKASLKVKIIKLKFKINIICFIFKN